MASPLDRFTVLQRLGAGGMAEVYKCRQTGLGGFEKVVVLKRILPHLVSEEAFVTMFLDEARIAANLSHPNIVQTFEITQDARGVPYIVMEYVDGPSFAQVIKRARECGAVDLRHLARLLAGASRGLHHAHHANDAQGRPLHIIHRDISPQNILISLDGVAKLADFGVARAEGRITHTQSGVVKGKLRFTSPEMLIDPDHCRDPRTDVFSLGVCLYLATTGQMPFTGSTDYQVMEAIRRGVYPPPTQHVADYPPGLERVLGWLLENDAQRRCPSALAAAEALDEWVASTTGSASTELGPWLRALPGSVVAEPPPPPPDSSPVLVAEIVETSAVPVEEIEILETGFTATREGRRWGLFALLFMAALTLAAVGLGLHQTKKTRSYREEREALLQGAEEALKKGRFGHAEELLERGAAVPDRSPADQLRLGRLEADLRLSRELAAAKAAIASGDLEAASALLRTVQTLEPADERSAELDQIIQSITLARERLAQRERRRTAMLAAQIEVVDAGTVIEGPALDRPKRDRASTVLTALQPSPDPVPATPTPEEPPPPLAMSPPTHEFEPPPVAKKVVPVKIQREHHAGAGTRITITASAPAQIFLDGLPVGATPHTLANVGVSTHLVMVWAEGYESITERIAVGADEAVTVHFPLSKTE